VTITSAYPGIRCASSLFDISGMAHHPCILSVATATTATNVVDRPVHFFDLSQATILHCLVVDHTRMTYKFKGRQFVLTVLRASGEGIVRTLGFVATLPTIEVQMGIDDYKVLL